VPKNTYELTPEVKDILSRATASGDTLDLAPVGQLDRKTYEAVNKALEMLGGKWNRGRRVHVFPKPVEQVLAEVLDKGEVFDSKKAFQVFETPQGLAEQMAGVDWLDMRSGLSLLEPSAGRGRLVKAGLAWMGNFQDRLTAVEIQPELVADLRKNFPGIHVVESDFLEYSSVPLHGFDRILMNPPFTGGQDVLHIARAFTMLKPAGKLVGLMAPGWLTNGQKKFKNFRDWVEFLGPKFTYEKVPAGTFKESGTDIATILIKIEA
jgi:hypothetical protein